MAGHENAQARPAWLLCPLQQPQDNGAALCMPAWQEGRSCTFGACCVYREIAALLNVREALRRRVGELEQAIKLLTPAFLIDVFINSVSCGLRRT